MRWNDEKIIGYLTANTAVADKVLGGLARPGLWTLIKLHWMRCGWLDHLLAGWLIFPTFGVSAWIWKRWGGSCCFAGFIERDSGRVGCLLHPARYGNPDLRRHAFPLLPTVDCNRALLCPMLNTDEADLLADAIAVSRRGADSLAKKSLFYGIKGYKVFRDGRGMKRLWQWMGFLVRGERGDVLMEYVVLTCAIVFPLIGLQWSILNVTGGASPVAIFNPNPLSGSTLDFGLLGKSFFDWYQNLVFGVSLPFP
jgi:hypothetical protein